MSRRDLWKGLAIGVAWSVVLTLLLPPEAMTRFAPVLVPFAVLVSASSYGGQSDVC